MPENNSLPNSQISNEPQTPNTAQEGFFNKIISLIKNKKIFIPLLIVIIIVFILTIIILSKPKTTVDNTPEPQPVTLRIWSFSENSDHYKKIMDDYRLQNPLVTILFEQRPLSDYRDILIKRLKENQASLPDIFEVDSKDVYTFQSAISPAPNDIINGEDFQKMYFSQVQNDNLLGTDSVYGIPTGIDGLMLVFNTNLVKESDIPTYWPDFIRYAQSKTIHSTDNTLLNEQNGIAVSSTTKTNYFADISQLLLLQNKLKSFYDPENPGLFKIDSKIAIDALNEYKQLVSKLPWDEREDTSIDAFIGGRTAFAIVKASDINKIQNSKIGSSFKTHVMPIISEQIYWSDYTSYVVNNSLPNSTEAWKFLKYFSSDSVSKELFTTAKDFNLDKKPYALKSLIEDLKLDPMLAPIGVMAPNMINWTTPDYVATDTEFTNFIKSTIGSDSLTNADIDALDDNLNKITPSYP